MIAPSESASPGAPGKTGTRGSGKRSARPTVAPSRRARRGTERRPVVLALVGYYPPAFRAGGPTRSLPGILRLLADELEFRVLSRDHDLGARDRLDGIVVDRWVETDGGRVRYLPTAQRPAVAVLGAIRRTPHDVLYVNSIFAVQFGLLPLLLRRIRVLPRRGLVIAPRGELDHQALAIKGRRKRLVLAAMRALGLTTGAVWHTATADEAEAVRREFGAAAEVLVARDLPVPPLPSRNAANRRAKRPGALRAVFLGRVARIKNLDYAIRVLTTLGGGEVTLDVLGPREDEAYWDECRALAERLPPSIRVAYRGVVAPDDVPSVLARYDLLFLPSKGESFGHAIVEALLAGCPVLISDQTPWHGLETRRAGWDLPLSGPEGFADALRTCIAMTDAEHAAWSEGAQGVGREIVEDPGLEPAYRAVFRAALS